MATTRARSSVKYHIVIPSLTQSRTDPVFDMNSPTPALPIEKDTSATTSDQELSLLTPSWCSPGTPGSVAPSPEPYDMSRSNRSDSTSSSSSSSSSSSASSIVSSDWDARTIISTVSTGIYFIILHYQSNYQLITSAHR